MKGAAYYTQNASTDDQKRPHLQLTDFSGQRIEFLIKLGVERAQFVVELLKPDVDGLRTPLHLRQSGAFEEFVVLRRRVSHQKRTHEGSVVAQDATTLVANSVCGHELWIDAKTSAIFFILSEAREAEDRKSPIARAFRG